MSIGSFGDIVFDASADLVRTFSDLQQNSSGRWAQHDVIGKKPLLEFLGPGLEEISFKIMLLSAFGVSPDTELKTLQQMRDTGKVGTLIFGDTKIGKFVLTDISSTEGPRDRYGSPTWIDVSVTIKEYKQHGE